MRLDRFLTDFGVGSRSAVRELIKKGRIRVNGAVIKIPDTAVDPEDRVVFDEKEIEQSTFEYYLMNKPGGVLTAMRDPKKPTVAEYLPTGRKDVKPVGRLDADVTGALVFTNDGMLTHRLLSPKRKVVKVYHAFLGSPLPTDAEERLKEPLQYGDVSYAVPLTFTRIGDTEAKIAVTEGKYHEVKRIFELIGAPVRKLHRESFAGLSADTLPEGGARKLEEEEIAALYRAAGLERT